MSDVSRGGMTQAAYLAALRAERADQERVGGSKDRRAAIDAEIAAVEGRPKTERGSSAAEHREKAVKTGRATR